MPYTSKILKELRNTLHPLYEYMKEKSRFKSRIGASSYIEETCCAMIEEVERSIVDFLIVLQKLKKRVYVKKIISNIAARYISSYLKGEGVQKETIETDIKHLLLENGIESEKVEVIYSPSPG